MKAFMRQGERMTDVSPKEEKRQEYLQEHERLARLFVTDRLAFERERRRLIEQTIEDSCRSAPIQERMRGLQKNLDRILKSAGSNENRLALIQAFFWDHIVNKWQPTLHIYLEALHSCNKKMKRIK